MKNSLVAIRRLASAAYTAPRDRARCGLCQFSTVRLWGDATKHISCAKHRAEISSNGWCLKYEVKIEIRNQPGIKE